MRSIILVLILGLTPLASNVAVEAQARAATTVPVGAPIGHLQPRAQQFAPGSAAERAEQQEMSNFDAHQKKLDDELDKRFLICRGC